MNKLKKNLMKLNIFQILDWCWEFGKENEVDYREIYIAYCDWYDRCYFSGGRKKKIAVVESNAI